MVNETEVQESVQALFPHGERIRIVSNGSPIDTVVYIGDRRLEGVQAIEWKMDVDTLIGELKLTLIPALIDFDLAPLGLEIREVEADFESDTGFRELRRVGGGRAGASVKIPEQMLEYQSGAELMPPDEAIKAAQEKQDSIDADSAKAWSTLLGKIRKEIDEQKK